MTTVPALSAPAAGAPLERATVERREVGPTDVSLRVEWCGVCHSDIHAARGEWGSDEYPMTPGHEIVGTVDAVGSEVTAHAVGDRVGVGCMVDSCRTCAPCRAGQEQYCARGAVMTYDSRDHSGQLTYGGYSAGIVVTQDFVVRIPDALDPAAAAPLLCAGITMWSPLRHWGVEPGTRVAVVGLGGLGHMGVQLAAALGAEVTVLSQSLAKEQDGRALGAADYRATADGTVFRELRGAFDLILNTVSVNLPLDRYLRMLDLDGTLVNVGVPAEPDTFRVGSLITGRRSMAGSNIGGIAETQEMLDVCAASGIAARIEVVGADDVNEAWERVLASDVRYRFVVDGATLQ